MTPATSSAPGRYPPWRSGIDPAPGDLRIVQAFVNSLSVLDGADRWATPEALAAWLAEWRLAEDPAVGEAERRQAVELREGLRQLLLANAGYAVEAASLDGLERLLATLPLRCQLNPRGDYRLAAASDGWPAAAGRVLTLVTHAMADGTWSRLKACRRDDCRWVYYDSSKNRSGRWCSMAGCGNLMKARAHRERLRS